MKKSKKINVLAEVTWSDACDLDIDDELMETLPKLKSGKHLLATNITYGKILSHTKDVLVIMYENSSVASKDVCVIPAGWIKRIKYLKYK